MLVQTVYVLLFKAVAAGVNAVFNLLRQGNVILLLAAGQKLVHAGKRLVQKSEHLIDSVLLFLVEHNLVLLLAAYDACQTETAVTD